MIVIIPEGRLHVLCPQQHATEVLSRCPVPQFARLKPLVMQSCFPRPEQSRTWLRYRKARLGSHQYLPEEIGHPFSAHSRMLTRTTLQSPPSERHFVVPSDHICVLRVELTCPRVTQFHTCCFFHIPCRDSKGGNLVIPPFFLVIVTPPSFTFCRNIIQ